MCNNDMNRMCIYHSRQMTDIVKVQFHNKIAAIHRVVVIIAPDTADTTASPCQQS